MNSYFCGIDFTHLLLTMNFRYLTACLLWVCFYTATSYAQPATGAKSDPTIEAMLQAYVKGQQAKQTMPGFRVQIVQDSNRETARTEKINALLKFPQYETYEVYESPTFKIRVGDFKSRIVAYRALNNLKMTFKRAFIVEDRVQVAKAQ